MRATKPDERVLILAPVGRDAAAIANLLKDQGFAADDCGDAVKTWGQQLDKAGALLLTEEALELPETANLIEQLQAQPSWSELPLIILTHGGEPRLATVLDLAATSVGAVTLLERPLSSATLLRSVEVALRSRRRQYQVRDLLEEERRRQHELEEARIAAEEELVDRKRAEQTLARLAKEQTVLYHFTDKLHRASSLDEIYNAALDSIVDGLGCNRASILLFDDSGLMRFVAWHALSESYRKAVDGHSPWKPDESDPKPIMVEEIAIADFPPSLKEVVRREGINALAFIPVVASGKLFGKFMAYYDAPHEFTAEELDLANNLARQLGFGIERKRAEESVARLAAIIKSSEDAIVSKDLDGIITSWNRGAERLFGYTAQEVLGRPITVIIPTDRLEEEPRILARIRSGEPVEHFETVRRRKDGRLLDISLTVSPIVDVHGKIVGASKIARDITDQKRAEQKLRHSEERYRTLVEQVKDYAIFRMDLQGRPSSWNAGVRRVLGFEEPDFIGQDVLHIFTPDDLQAGVPEQELRQAAEMGSASNERWMRRADGTRFYASGVTSGLHNEAGELVGFSKVLRDNMAVKTAELQLAEARAKLAQHASELENMVAERTKDLQATNEQLEAFVYSIAHDLRTPLRTLTGFSQLLLDDYAGQLEPTAQQFLKRIHGSAEFMDKLLLDLLAFGRTARAEIELGPVAVEKAWEAAVFQCASQIDQSEAQVQTVLPLPTVIAHEATLGQCLANLLSNGLKFVATGVRPEIRFWSEERNGSVRLWVKDNGLGIPAKHRDRVFRVFERLHGARFSGTGIGLSIVRKGVERMQGGVGLESEPGQGSRFWVELPKAKQEPS